MDSVEAERAGLKKDLDEVNTEIRRVNERLADVDFIAKAKRQLVEEQRALLNQLTSRRSRLELNLETLESRKPGALPAVQAGTWTPLALHEWNRPPLPVEPVPVSRTPLGTIPVARREPTRQSPEELSRRIGAIVLSNHRGKHGVADLRSCITAAGTDNAPALRLIAAAFDGFGRDDLARQLRAQISRLTGEPERKDTFPEPPEIHPLAALHAAELPDPRDGLTRMERLVLSAMHALWFRADGAPKRTALVVEELRLSDPSMPAEKVDATLARLTHPWSARNPLVEVLGPVSRLTPLGEALFAELEGGPVDLEPGYTFKLPRVVPTPFPLLLAKGTDGIPPHALSELLLACMHLLQFPGATHGEIMGCLPGPDFATGGALETPASLYWKGHGVVTIAPRVDLQLERTLASARFVLSEFPWPLTPAEARRRLAACHFEGVTEVREEGTCLIVQLEHVAYAAPVRASLLTSRALTETFDAELRFERDGEAAIGPIKEVLGLFLDHRRELVSRRLRDQLEKRLVRAEAVEGLLVALGLLEPIMKIIGDADDAAERFWGLTHLASPELTSRVSFEKHAVVSPETLKGMATALVPAVAHDYLLGFSEVQARAILATRKPAALERETLLREWATLGAEAADLRSLLADPGELDRRVLRDLAEQRQRHTQARRTVVGIR
jgi:hypothetical protein